jgi:CDP-6-deoxy-D-xylo-4-hexulose-3-dehydrase
VKSDTAKAAGVPVLDWPLMDNNITRADLDAIIDFLRPEPAPILTQSVQVQGFEEDWSRWLGVKHSVFVNSGSSANLITMCALRALRGPGKIIVPTLTWVSDIASVLQAGFEPVFVDIDPRTLGMNTKQVAALLDDDVKAVFLTHVLGYNGLDDFLLETLAKRGIPLIEDVCESHGARHRGKKLGSLGYASNFSFYYAHHMSTIEGGMVCTNDEEFYETLRMFRSHGMVREMKSTERKKAVTAKYPDLNPDFIFCYPAYNVRSTEINAVLGRHQLRRLDENNQKRQRNLEIFLKHLDSRRYRTEFAMEGQCNYAFTLVLNQPDDKLRDRVQSVLRAAKVEFRRGASGGGSQIRQPFVRQRFPALRPEDYPEVDHVHFYGFYLGNYPSLQAGRIQELCALLNRA